jgi:diguanylate cyclase
LKLLLMLTIVNDLLLLLLAAVVGAVVGYFYRAPATPADVFPPPTAADEASLPLATDETREFLISVQQVTQKVAAGVGAHSVQVRQFNSQLHENGCDVASVLAKLIHANERMAQQLADSEARLKTQAMMIDLHISESRTDALTGLANRRAFNDEMANQLSQFEKHGTPVCVLMLDIDYFKKLNDVHGHLVGDDVLMCVGRTITQQVRSGDFAARYGGEEFAVIFPRTTADQARSFSERVREAVSRSVCQISNKPIRITASAGLSQLQPNDSIKTWVHRADEALYFSKDSGRNCGHWNDGGTFKPLTETIKPEPRVHAPIGLEASKLVRESGLTAADNDDLLDPATQLLSTGAFNKYFGRALADNRRTGETLSVIMIRVDRYNELADRYGINGDGLVLRIIGRLLSSSVRASDYVARYSNDSLALILPTANLTNAAEVAERFRASVEKLVITLTKEPLKFTVSIGAGEERGNDGSAPLIDRVKRAVAIASSRGGNQVVISDGEVFERVKFDSPNGSVEPRVSSAIEMPGNCVSTSDSGTGPAINPLMGSISPGPCSVTG